MGILYSQHFYTHTPTTIELHAVDPLLHVQDDHHLVNSTT